ncbi:MAG: hypothetical protein ACREO8_00125, partial [Luteimonas sp.]
AEIGAGDIPQVLVYNKIDMLHIDRSDGDSDRPAAAPPRHDRPGGDQPDAGARERVWVSARDRSGLDLLDAALAARLGLRRIAVDLRLPPGAGRLHARLHALDAVREESYDVDGWRLSIDLAIADAARLAAQDDGAPLRALLPADVV